MKCALNGNCGGSAYMLVLVRPIINHHCSKPTLGLIYVRSLTPETSILATPLVQVMEVNLLPN